MQGDITIIKSKNHKIEHTGLNKSTTEIRLAELQDKLRVPEKDFILYIRDSNINKPYGFCTKNKDNEQALLFNVLVSN